MGRKVATRTKTGTTTKVGLAIAASGVILAAGFASVSSIQYHRGQIQRHSAALPYQTAGYTPGYTPGYVPGHTPGYGVPGYVPGYGTFHPLTPRQVRRWRGRTIRTRILRPWRTYTP